MITYTIYKSDYKSAKFKIQCLSTDQKPINNIQNIKIRNGSKLYELDTNKKYIYDEQNLSWHEISSSSGGGQPSGSGGVFYIDVTADYNRNDEELIDGWRITSILTEFTFNEITQKLNQGINIYIRILSEEMNLGDGRVIEVNQILFPLVASFKANFGGMIIYQLVFVDMFGIALVAPKILQDEGYSQDGLKSYGLYATDPDASSTDTQKWTIESPIYVGRS